MSRPPRHWTNGSAAIVAVMMMATSVVWCSRTDPRRRGPSTEIHAVDTPADTSADSIGAADTLQIKPQKKRAHKQPSPPPPRRSPLDELL